ncbi:MAG TPA: hypothetical protein VNW54_11990 [Granulicella sp.]|jgi:hypothetical protein|nr:hypothetical protein [Granulicella sp.]
MAERDGLFSTPNRPVESLAVQASSAIARREQTQFEVLVRHLLHRFFHNELLSPDDETKRVMLLSYAAALPGLLVALFLFPAYHAFPPAPLHRPFWSQAGDHYFYVSYPFVVMGIATVYEWDLLFPDLLDVFVLSNLPIPMRRLFAARVLALAIFLSLVLLGTNGLGIVFFPMIAELPGIGRHFLAHAIAALMSGTFAATTFLALQGILLNTLGEHLFRRITPLLQGASLMVLLAVLLVFPMVAQSLQALLTSNAAAVRSFPPFWFLGIYERILAGPSAPLIFHTLAHTGCWAVLLMIACTLLTYPLAYRRRVRQLIEGASFIHKTSRTAGPIERLLHASILLLPAQRAIFHFVSQTILRNQRQRVMLAMYGGLGIAIALSEMLVLRTSSGHLHLSLLPEGIRSAVPIMAFWTIAGLSSVLATPIDRRGAWLFQVLLGRARADHLAGARLWITLWALLVSLGTVLVLHPLSPASLRNIPATVDQLFIAVSVSFLLADIFFLNARTLPFTHLRKGSITDLPLRVVRYFVLFPFFVAVLVGLEPWIESNVHHLLGLVCILGGLHLLLVHEHTRSVQDSAAALPADDADDFPQSLGLRDS